MDSAQLPKTNGWSNYQELVMETLERHGRHLDGIDEKLTDIRVLFAGLQAKATAWGAIAGVIAGGIFGLAVELLARALIK